MLRLFSLLLILVLFVVSWFTRNYYLSSIGASLYILILVVDLISFTLVAASNNMKPAEVILMPKKNISHKIATVVEVVITIIALFAFISDYDSIERAGFIIWFGTMIIWVFGGRVVKFFTGIPLRMGAGGWFVDKK